MRERRATARETHALYSSGFRLTSTSIKLDAAVTTPFNSKNHNQLLKPHVRAAVGKNQTGQKMILSDSQVL